MSAYTVEPRNPYFCAIASMCANELRPRNTVTFMSEVDLLEVERLRARAFLAKRRKPSYTALVVKAVTLALADFPYANRRVFRRPFGLLRIQAFDGIDATVACERDVPGAPMATFVDVIRDVNTMDLPEITERLHRLATCDTRTNRQWREFSGIVTRLPSFLTALALQLPVWFPSLWAKYRGGPLLVSAPAKYGVDVVGATWPWPLGVSFGLVRERPVVKAGALAACPTFTLTLNWDRRVMAGAQAARFFKRIVDILERAETELAQYLALPEEKERVTSACTEGRREEAVVSH